MAPDGLDFSQLKKTPASLPLLLLLLLLLTDKYFCLRRLTESISVAINALLQELLASCPQLKLMLLIL